MSKEKPIIGLALGSGGARGWAHVGAIQALFSLGIRPQIITGASIGALAGAMLAAGVFDAFTRELERLDWLKLARFFAEVRFPRHGLLSGKPVLQWLNQPHLLNNRSFADLDLPLAIVATDLDRGEPVILREGNVSEAIRASFAIPGVFDPVIHEGRLLIDGGFTDPVPVQAARALGADYVIAIDINTHAPNATLPHPKHDRPPALLNLLIQTTRMVENRICKESLAQAPADLLLTPAVGHIQTLDFYAGRSAIEAGTQAVLAHKDKLRSLLP